MFSLAPFSTVPFSSLAGGGAVAVAVTGVEATGELGSVTIQGVAYVYLTGLEGTTALGNATATAAADASVTGVYGTGEIGTVTVIGKAVVNLTGVQGTTALGNATVTADAIVTVTGVQAVAENGDVTVIGKAVINVTGLQGTTALGNATVEADANAPVTGVFATSAIGSVTVTGTAVVNLPSLRAQTYLSNVIVWGQITTNDGSLTPELLTWIDTKEFNDYFLSTTNQPIGSWNGWQYLSLRWPLESDKLSVGYGTGKTLRYGPWNVIQNTLSVQAAVLPEYVKATDRQYLSFRLTPDTPTGYYVSESRFGPGVPPYPPTGAYISLGMGYAIEIFKTSRTDYLGANIFLYLDYLAVVPTKRITVVWEYDSYLFRWVKTQELIQYELNIVRQYKNATVPSIIGSYTTPSLQGDWRIRTYDNADGSIGYALEELVRETFAQGAKNTWTPRKTGTYLTAADYTYKFDQEPITRQYAGIVFPKSPLFGFGSYLAIAQPPSYVENMCQNVHFGLSQAWGSVDDSSGSQTAGSWSVIPAGSASWGDIDTNTDQTAESWVEIPT